MSNQTKRCQDAGVQIAGILATINLLVFALAALALWSLFSLAARVGEFFGAAVFKTPLMMPLILGCASLAATAQTVGDEEILRELIRREAAGEVSVKYSESAIFATDLLPRPKVLKSNEERQIVFDARKNGVLKIEIRRIRLAGSKDIAYEYSDFTLTYDQPDLTRDGYSGSILRVWRKTGGEWHVDAAFVRQNAPDARQQDKEFLPTFSKNNQRVPQLRR